MMVVKVIFQHWSETERWVDHLELGIFPDFGTAKSFAEKNPERFYTHSGWRLALYHLTETVDFKF